MLKSERKHIILEKVIKERIVSLEDLVKELNSSESTIRRDLDELEAEFEQGDTKHAQAELGDVLFSLVNAARLYQLNPDSALEQTNQKFIRRFSYVEAQAKAQGRALSNLSLEEMEALWNEAKRKEEK